MKTFEEWVEIYEKKSGDKHEVPHRAITLFDSSRGFLVFTVFPDKSALLVCETCGDGVYWYEKCIKICREHNIPKLMTICTRKIIPYIKLMRGTITEKKIEKKIAGNKHFYAYRIKGVNHFGKPFDCFGAWYDHEKRRSAYYVVTEV